MMLTLLLQSLKWKDVSERKKEKAIKKLSRFFLVPRVSVLNFRTLLVLLGFAFPATPSFVSLMSLRPFNSTRIVSRPQQFITVSDIHEPQILEMLKHSINKSNNLLNTKDTVARFEFMIGCGDKMFDNGNNIARNINEHISSGALDELAGLPFSWWNIWSKHVKSRVQRTRRQTDGSGNDEEVEEYYDEEDEGQDQDTELLDTEDDYEANEE